MRNLSFWRTVAIAFTIAVACLCVHAADVNGRIKGNVTDPAGAVVANASITATNEATGVRFTTTSQSDGEYIFQQLPIGTYTITVTATGFKSFTGTGIILNIDEEYVEPVKLAVGNTTEIVTVAADAVQVNTTDMQLGNVVDSSQMVELPLIDRSFNELELTLPGVQVSSDRFGGAYSVSGAQTQQSEYLINGADSNDIALNTLAISPNLDAIAEFNLITGPLNAEYDRNSGGIVSATIKSGTNKIHGDGFEFYRDTFLNTLSYFQKQLDESTGVYTGVVTPFHQNIYGGTIGAPILKNKLFGFFAYQGTHQRVPEGGGTVTNQVFTPAEMSGNFSADTNPNSPTPFSSKPIPGTITIPGCTTPGETWVQCLGSGDGGLNGMVPASAFNSISTNLVTKYVPPTASGQYTINEVDTTTAGQYMGRIDFNPNPRNQFYFVGINQKTTTSETLPFTGASVPGFGDLDVISINQYTFDYARQFGQTAVNDLAAHWTRYNAAYVLPQSVVDPTSLGFQVNPQDAAADSVPTLNVAGYFTLGFSTNGPQPRIDQVYQLDDNFSKVLGRHSLKFGYDGRRFNVSNPFYARNSGSYAFNTANSSPYGTGDPGLDFLLGIPASYSQGSGADIQADAFLNYWFGQDTWKMTDSLTLDYGVGYSIDTPLRDHQYNGEAIACLIPGQQSGIFSTAPSGIDYPGDPGCTESGLAKTRHGEFGPRFGFAYAPTFGWLSDGNNRKFSIRGGFGIYYDRTEEETSLQTLETPPFGLSSSGVTDYDGGTPSLANPYTDLNTGAAYTNKFPYKYPVKGQTINYAPLEPMDISTYPSNFRAPYAENFQLTLEREFPQKIVARVSYVGSLGRHNQITYEGNPETAAGHAACLASAACQGNSFAQSYFYPQNTAYGEVDPNTGSTAFFSVGEVGSEAESNYHALQVSVEKGLTHGLQFQLSYTYAHALDNGSSFENSGFAESARGFNQYDEALNYGSSAYDARQHLVFAPIYVTPMLHGEWYSPLNLAVSGWEISGITALATGFPYDISYNGYGGFNSLWCAGGDYSFYACPDVPLQTAPLVTSSPRGPRNTTPGSGIVGDSLAFAATSFAEEPIGSFGNISRNKYHGPGINSTNMILAKNFPLGADGVRRLQIRLESDNVFNHTQFSNPGSNFDEGPTFGYYTGSLAARQTQLAAKFYF
jgi:hypothetical protein